jgi:hypothetical protein
MGMLAGRLVGIDGRLRIVIEDDDVVVGPQLAVGSAVARLDRRRPHELGGNGDQRADPAQGGPQPEYRQGKLFPGRGGPVCLGGSEQGKRAQTGSLAAQRANISPASRRWVSGTSATTGRRTTIQPCPDRSDSAPPDWEVWRSISTAMKSGMMVEWSTSEASNTPSSSTWHTTPGW